MDYLDKQVYTVNKDAFGQVRIWSLNADKGIDKLLLDQPNLIVNQGADIAAKALSGLANTSISHIYVSYSSGTTPPSVALTDDVSTFGTFARIPLSFSPSFANETNYSNNLVYFTAYITGTTIPNGQNIMALGLINATTSSSAGDKLFSKISFSPIVYQSAYGIAITWGLTFRSS